MKLRTFLLIVAVFLSGSGYAYGADGPPPAKVVVAKISVREVTENKEFIGFLSYDRQSRISSEVTGLIESVAVREADTVKKGDVLVRLDTERLDNDISLKRTRLKQTELKIDLAEKNYKRIEGLYAQQAASEKAHDDVQFAYQDLVLEKKAVESELNELLIQKKKSVITAPYAGVILAKAVDSGDWVQQGKELVRLGASADLVVKVPVAETLLRFAHIGDKVDVVLNAYDRGLVGIIDSVDPKADEKTKNVFIKVRLPAIKGVAENMSANVFVPVSAKKELKIIPRDALIKFQGKDFVYSVKDGKAAIMPVHIVTYLGHEIGADNPYFVPGMPVVIEGNERLRPDQAVVIAGEK